MREDKKNNEQCKNLKSSQENLTINNENCDFKDEPLFENKLNEQLLGQKEIETYEKNEDSNLDNNYCEKNLAETSKTENKEKDFKIES